jgi:hypothetical protein
MLFQDLGHCRGVQQLKVLEDVQLVIDIKKLSKSSF